MADAQAIPVQWEAFRDALRSRVTPVTWQTWLAPLAASEHGPGQLRIVAPSELHRRWVHEKYLNVLDEAAAMTFGPHVSLVVEARDGPLLADSAEEFTLDDEPSPAPAPVSRIGPPDHSGITGRYSFENFVVGQSNRFAHAAAMAVAEQPGSHYNPLFIYGGVGLGKTHLLHAIGRHGCELHPNVTGKYVSSERFFNEFIEGIRRKRMDDFKARYRTTDILLLDDVQFFQGKEQILEEFFHTFNSLYESGKQLVITSDRHPRNLSSLEDRLRSRFEWGLLTDIQPPDVETRLAILRKNAELVARRVPTDVLEFIAHNVSNNIRELEGALTRVTAYAALTHQQVVLDMVQDVLQDLLPTQHARPATPEEILTLTADSFGCPVADLKSPSRRQPLARARQVAMYLCREHTDLSLPKIGAVFGGRDHTTVIHAVEKVKRLMQSDQQIFDLVTALSQNLRRT
ncbi:MAG: chromosomal replication initiator protein DnaA [Actinomycetota bacterium]|nr:chromosomal replication initiator protein DnaA [Actinomycetota bacterium]